MLHKIDGKSASIKRKEQKVKSGQSSFAEMIRLLIKSLVCGYLFLLMIVIHKMCLVSFPYSHYYKITIPKDLQQALADENVVIPFQNECIRVDPSFDEQIMRFVSNRSRLLLSNPRVIVDSLYSRESCVRSVLYKVVPEIVMVPIEPQARAFG